MEAVTIENPLMHGGIDHKEAIAIRDTIVSGGAILPDQVRLLNILGITEKEIGNDAELAIRAINERLAYWEEL